MTHRKHSKYLSLLLSAVLVLTMIHKWWIPSVADDPVPPATVYQDGITYNHVGDGRYEAIIADVSGAESVSGNDDITVPGGYTLEIRDTDFNVHSISVQDGGSLLINTSGGVEKTVTVDSLNLATGSNLEIFGDGRLAGAVNASADAGMSLGSYANKPASIAALYGTDAQTAINSCSGTHFIYLGDEQKWAIDASPYCFYVDFGDYPGTFDVAIYKESTPLTSVVTWNNPDMNAKVFMVTDGSWNPWTGDPATVKVTVTTPDSAENPPKTFVDAGIGWDDNIMNYATCIMDPARVEGRTFTYTYTNPADLDGYPHDMHFAVGYPNSGMKEIVDTVDNYLYAYDITYTDTDATIDRLAQELYARFFEVSMFESFGLDMPGPDDDNATLEAKRANNLPILKSKIQAVGDPYTITVTLANGTPVARNAQNYQITWGVDMNDGSPVVSTIPVYELADHNEFLVCTDFGPFNTTTERQGSTFYSRIANQDEIQFYDDATQRECVIYSNVTNYSGIMAGGNGSEMIVQNSDGIFTFQIATRYPDNARFADWGTRCRILSSTETYVALLGVDGEKEEKAYGGLGLNGVEEDNVWRAKTTTNAAEVIEAHVYIGDSSIYIASLGNDVTGVDSKKITSVTLDDSSLAGGVTIGGAVDGKVKVTFASNFYDRIPVTITYEDGTKSKLVIVRVGLVIQYEYLFDQGDGVHTGEIRYDCKPDMCTFDYDYFGKGEQVLVYATYYHPSNDHTTGNSDELYLNLRFADGSSRIISSVDNTRNFNGYRAANGGAVATTSFIIGFAPAKELDQYGVYTDNIISQTYCEGPFNATVLNAGYNDATTYGGTQSGSGKGVYWDAQINWYK